MPRRATTVPQSSAASVKRLEAKVDALLEAQTKFIGALGDLLAYCNAPRMITAAGLPDRIGPPGAFIPAPKPPPPPRRYNPEKPGPALVERAHIPPAIDQWLEDTPTVEINPGERGGAPSDGNGSPAEVEEEGPQAPQSYEDMRAEFAEMVAELDEPPPPPDERALWDVRLRVYRRANVWNPDWGPRPGQDGCRVPQDLLSARAA